MPNEMKEIECEETIVSIQQMGHLCCQISGAIEYGILQWATMTLFHPFVCLYVTTVHSSETYNEPRSM